jgi:hypothetical protein
LSYSMGHRLSNKLQFTLRMQMRQSCAVPTIYQTDNKEDVLFLCIARFHFAERQKVRCLKTPPTFVFVRNSAVTA